MTSLHPLASSGRPWAGWPIFFSVLLSLALLAGTGRADPSPFPVEAMDSLGREIRIEKVPRRIVSICPTTTEILYDLGLRDRVIAVTKHCVQTCDVSGKEIINGWASVDIDRVIALKPDLVMAFGGLQAPTIDRLQESGIPTFSFYPGTVAETLYFLRVIGKITGTRARAEELLGAVAPRWQKIREKTGRMPREKRVTFLRLISPKEVIVAGRYSFQNDILVQAGGESVMKEFLQAYGRVELQKIQTLDPDFIVLNGDDEREVKKRFRALEGWKDLSAAKRDRIKVMPCRQICHPNFHIVDVVEIMGKVFHPGLFP